MLIIANGLAYAKNIPNQGLCSANEANLFNCELKNKNASLCINKQTRLIQYRFGTRLKKDLLYPQAPEKNEHIFKLSTTPYPGGGENRIRFTNGVYSYFLYDITKTQRDTSSLNSIQTAGIAVYEKNKKIANLKCENSETSISPLAFEILQREEFYYDISTD